MQTRRFVCEKCGKKCSEKRDLQYLKGLITNDMSTEMEYYDMCEKCGRKQLKKERFTMRIGSAIEQKLIDPSFVEKWKNKEISQKEFLETMQRKEKQKSMSYRVGGDY